MSLAELLDTDVGNLGTRLKQGVVWWLDELRDLAKPLTQQGKGQLPPVWVEEQTPGTFVVKRPGRSDELYTSGARTFHAAVALPAQAVLIHALSRPPLADRDLRRLIALDLDRLTPFAAETVYHNIDVLPGLDGEGRREIRLAVILRPSADQILERAFEAGVEPTAVIAIRDDDVIDFLPAMRAAGVLGPRSRAYLLWGVIAALVVLNVGVAIWRDVQATNVLQAAVATQQPLVAQIQALRQQTAALQAQASQQAAARLTGEPLRVIDGLSRALPAGAWVQRLSWDGTAVKAAGQQVEGTDVVGALRHDPLFTDVHAADTGSSPAGTSFDVTATIVPALRR